MEKEDRALLETRVMTELEKKVANFEDACTLNITKQESCTIRDTADAKKIMEATGVTQSRRYRDYLV